jgi:flagellum-specific peptidoglycan hydrolase FlgJ
MKSPHKSFFLIFCCLLSLTATAQTRWNAQYQQYIDKWSGVAVEQMQRYKIPASITLAQGLLESGAGQSELARKGNNHFGIKCHNGWTGPTMYRDDDQRNDCFRV